MGGMRKRWRRLIVAALAVGALAAGAWWGWRSALHHVPRFYAVAVAVPSPQQKAAGQELARNVLALHNEVADSQQWSAVFTDQQINGWLAVDLPEKFPHLLPRQWHDPRVALLPDQIHVACRYQDGRLDTVVSLILEVRLAKEPNTLAVRIRGARAGAVPLPLRWLLDGVTESLQQGDLLVRWSQSDGDPVALVTLHQPAPQDDAPRPILERIEIRAGELRLAGRSVLPD